MHKIITFAAEELKVKLYPGQAAALDEYYTSNKPNWLFLAGRRGGKSLISDIIACYEGLVPDFGDVLREEEERFIILLSVRQDSANLHIENISRLIRKSKTFRGMILERTRERIRLANGVTILSLPASGRAVRGYTASTVILDELAHFVDTQGNQSADSVYDAISPVLATFGDKGRMIITTTPAARSGIVYELYDRASQGELEDYHVTRADSRSLNPKVSERTINRAMNRDALSARVEYYAEFADPVSSYLDSETINRAVERRRRAEKGDPGQVYVMAIDPATMADRYAFVICHREEGRIIHDYSHIMTPPVDPNAAEELLFHLVKQFKPNKIRCDTASTVERLKGKIPELEYTPFSRPFKLKIYGALKEALNMGQLSLYPDEDLIDELHAIQIRNGVDIAAPKSGRVKHDDLADCLALCVEELSHEEAAIQVVKDPFANWPPNPGEIYHPVLGWGTWNTKPHRPGVTWQNCRYRNRGCEACAEEMEREGIFEIDEAIDIARMADSGGRCEEPPIHPGIAEESQRRETLLDNFWKMIQNKEK